MNKQEESDLFLRQDWEREEMKDLVFKKERTTLVIGDGQKPSSKDVPKIEVHEKTIRDRILPF